MTLSPVAANVWELNAPLATFGMHLGHRMTVVRLTDGTLWLHSPVAQSAALDAELARLGNVAHIVAPNTMHDTYLEGWFAAYRRARFHGAPGFAQARRDLKFTDTLGDQPDPGWADVLDQHVMGGMPRINEVVFFHRPTRTLIITDLAFNLGPDMPFLSRVLMKLNDSYCRFGPSRMLKSTIKDRAAFRRSIDHVLQWDFDRTILSHGENIPRDGKAMIREAFAFL
jgi:hypothetical protein